MGVRAALTMGTGSEERVLKAAVSYCRAAGKHLRLPSPVPVPSSQHQLYNAAVAISDLMSYRHGMECWQHVNP